MFPLRLKPEIIVSGFPVFPFNHVCPFFCTDRLPLHKSALFPVRRGKQTHTLNLPVRRGKAANTEEMEELECHGLLPA